MPISIDSRLDVFPSVSALDGSDVPARNGVIFSNIFVLPSVDANGENLLRGKTCALNRLTSRNDVASLSDHVRSVVAVSPKEQMVKINACGHVALVADAHAFWNRAMRLYPNKAMRSVLFAAPLNASVSTCSTATIPQLAAIFVRGRCVINQPPRERPMTRALKLFNNGFSHGVRFLRCCGQGWDGASTLPGPRILAEAA